MYVHIYIYKFHPLKGPESNRTPVTISAYSARILVSNSILQRTEPELLGEMADFGPRREVQDVPGGSCARKELREEHVKRSRCLKGFSLST